MSGLGPAGCWNVSDFPTLTVGHKREGSGSLVIQWLRTKLQCRGQGSDPWFKDSRHPGHHKPS